MNKLIAVVLLLSGLLFITCGGPPAVYDTGQPPRIRIIYPKADQTIGAVDSTFIFGHIENYAPDYKLTINDTPIPVHTEGGYLAFLPLHHGAFAFRLNLYETGTNAEILIDTVTLQINVPEPRLSVPADTLAIVGEYRPPIGHLSLAAGEELEFAFQGTPGLTAYASIEGFSDSIPMVEALPRVQPFWGENVFGLGAVPDSLMIAGIYTGRVTIPEGLKLIGVPVVYTLKAPGVAWVAQRALRNPNLANHLALIKYLAMPENVTYKTPWLLTTNSDDFPFVVTFTDSMQIIRHLPARGYFGIFQPAGTQALAVGQAGSWYRLKLSETQYAYCESAKVELSSVGSIPPKSLVRSLRTNSFADSVVVEIPLSGQHVYQVKEITHNRLKLRLYGVTSDTDWIRYDGSDSLIDFITWYQPEPDLYELNVNLTKPIWGYDASYTGNTFHLTLNRPPHALGSLKGKRIVIDPGHSADVGSVGPTGLTEATANLGLALELQRTLIKAGAEVIMTRNDMSHVGLYDRPVIAKAVDADLFVSVHNNALPDGVNPFVNNGVSTYYYHLHSVDLARAIQKEMVVITGANDHGLYYGNLAVTRPTQYPAVLVECAFMMLPEQEAALKTDSYRRKVAQAVTRGIEKFLIQKEREVNRD